MLTVMLQNSPEKSERLSLIRHSTAHILAAAVTKLYPGTKVAIGPSVENGFYYDFLFPSPISSEDLPAIEKEMRKIDASGVPFTRKEVSREEALGMFRDEPFKTELIRELPADAVISVYQTGDFTDLCRGPHVENSKDINAQSFKLMKLAGAYWRGDEKREMLTRIYGTAWETPAELKEYLHLLEEAARRDHRKIGREMDLFHIDNENPGQIFWHPDGWTIYRIITDYVREKIRKDGYLEVRTPFVMPQSLWERSGHWAKYRENMFITESEKRIFALKPMNCPGHVELFKQGTKSYRDLPIRIAEFGSCTRNEPSGSLHGIMRIRGFVQDDAHIFCTEEQVASEVTKFCKLLREIYHDFGFEPDSTLVKFSTRPELRVGTDADWDRAEGALAEACKQAGLQYEISPGEGAFYGPKLEFTLVDALGRQWQCGTIQLDYQLPSKERLNAEYIGEDDARHTPVMLHRAVLGSLERFIGILLENYAGALPPWLCPWQAAVIPVAQTFDRYAQETAAKLDQAGFRVFADTGNERMNSKIRKYQTKRIPYQLIVGQKEAENGTVSVRFRGGEQKEMKLEEFSGYLAEKTASKSVSV